MAVKIWENSVNFASPEQMTAVKTTSIDGHKLIVHSPMKQACALLL